MAGGQKHFSGNGRPKPFQGDLANLPVELDPLKVKAHWVCWRWEEERGAKGRVTLKKPLYQPKHPRRQAKTNDPRTWGTYDEALSAFKAGSFDGIGYCLTDSDFAAFDLDNCRDPATGQIAPWAKDLVDRAASYTEFTVSGTGLRIIGKAFDEVVHTIRPVPGVKEGRIECYNRAARYIVISGNPVAGDISKIQNFAGLMLEVRDSWGAATPGNPNNAKLNAGGRTIPARLHDIINAPPNVHKDHSAAFYKVVRELHELGLARGAIRSAIFGRPIVPPRYKKRLESEINRCLLKPQSARKAASIPIAASTFDWIDPPKIPMRDWLYGQHLIRGYVSLTVAPSGVGKSSLAVTEALAMCSGEKLLHAAPSGPLSVWLWNGEEPQEELQRRILATAIEHKLQPRDFADRLFVDAGRHTPINLAYASREGGVKCDDELRDKLVDTIRRNNIDVVIIDPLITTHEVSENDNVAMDRVIRAWEAVAEEGECAVHLIHHVRKTGGLEVEGEHSRGAGATIAAARSVRTINRMTENEAKKVGVPEPRLYIRLDDRKVNYSPPASRAHWHQIRSVDLGNGPKGSAGDQVGVVARWYWPKGVSSDNSAAIPLSPEEIANIQKQVVAGRDRRDAQSPDWVGHAVAKVKNLNVKKGAHKKSAKTVLAWLLDEGYLQKVSRSIDGRTRPCVEPGPGPGSFSQGSSGEGQSNHQASDLASVKDSPPVAPSADASVGQTSATHTVNDVRGGG